MEEIVVVDDDEIRHSMRLIFERMKLVVEPSAATVLAAALNPALTARTELKRVALVFSGGNVDLDKKYW